MNTKTKKYKDYDQNELVEAGVYLHIRTSNIQHKESPLQPITVDFDDELRHAYFSQGELTLLSILKNKGVFKHSLNTVREYNVHRIDLIND